MNSCALIKGRLAMCHGREIPNNELFFRRTLMLSIRTQSRRRSIARGFTLVEILIVVIILGILAAIVIPQFTNASTDAKKSNMASQDQTIKSQISLYMLQH